MGAKVRKTPNPLKGGFPVANSVAPTGQNEVFRAVYYKAVAPMGRVGVVQVFARNNITPSRFIVLCGCDFYNNATLSGLDVLV